MSPRLPELRSAVRSHPRNAALRLVFADLLLEHGDPRGLFIQAQAQGDEALAAQLLQRYRGHFLHPLPAGADVDFRAGFVDTWRTGPHDFRSAGRRFLRRFPLRALAVFNARWVDARYVLESDGLARVEQLTFPMLSAEALRRLCALEELPVRSVGLSSLVLGSVVDALPDSELGRQVRASAVRSVSTVPYFEVRVQP